MLKVCGHRTENSRFAIASKEKKAEKKTTCRAYLATKTFSPTNFYKMTWDLAIGFVYLVCYFVDPFIIAF